ncbi:hypothetical protein DENIS_1703 [Desulfonema ishimotonii]|uniref:Uncharacterized protein n=1 Tax=Desulfonema ishimotonii TaxID=45657 RepID=A0A401FUX5_9BACT|nr:hypothetical protein DENIS_1703 [Desulfonema ishimotonii]
MRKNGRKDTGIRLLIAHYKNAFRIPENLNHYSPEDYVCAEKQFIKITLRKGEI